MNSVKLLKNWLTNHKEIVLVSHDEECADLAIAIVVPEIGLWVHWQIVLIKHELNWLELVDLRAVDVSVALINDVVNIITSSKNHLRDNLVVKIARHEDMR